MFTNIKLRFWLTIAKLLAPALARTHIIFGDKKKVKISQSARLVNALLNTQSGTITVQDNVFFGHNVLLLTGSHNIHAEPKNRHKDIIESGRDILIEENVWLTSNVTVIGPCIIGRNSVILPGSVVNKDVPPNVIFGGVPAIFIKKINEE